MFLGLFFFFGWASYFYRHNFSWILSAIYNCLIASRTQIEFIFELWNGRIIEESIIYLSIRCFLSHSQWLECLHYIYFWIRTLWRTLSLNIVVLMSLYYSVVGMLGVLDDLEDIVHLWPSFNFHIFLRWMTLRCEVRQSLLQQSTPTSRCSVGMVFFTIDFYLFSSSSCKVLRFSSVDQKW